jgi:DNA sulfur modification protein DndD
MKVKSIAIENFKLLHNIQLAVPQESSNVVFLNARNGRGKTSFQAALKWCFYGETPEDSIVSKHELRETRIGDFIKVTVEVNFDEDNRVISVKRSQNFEKINDFESRASSQFELTIRISEPNSAIPTNLIPNPDSWLEENLPRRLMNFFLFDGELMYRFFDPKVKIAIDKAIKEIARVDLFEGIEAKFRQIELTANRQKAKNAGGDAEKFLEELESHRKLAAYLKNELDTNEEKSAQLRSELQGIALKLGGREHLQGYLEDQKSLRIQLDSLLTAREEKQNEFQARVLKIGVQTIFATAFRGFEEQVEIAKQNDRLPPPFEPSQLNLLLERGTCICGCDLAAAGEHQENIQGLIARYAESSDIGREIQQINNEVQNLRGQITAGAELLESMNSEIMRIDDSIVGIRNRLDQISIAIGDDDNEDVSELGRRQNIAMSEVEDLVRDRHDIDRQVTQVESKVTSAQAKYDKAVEGTEVAESLLQKAMVARLLADAAKKMHDDSIEIVRENLEITVSENFGFVKDGAFKTEINEEFEVITRDLNGQVVELSEGEKMLKAYLFSFALREVIGLSFPLIVDTPFGRLDEQYRLDIARGLSALIEKMEEESDIQSMFLMHDAEYTPYTKRVFKTLNAAEFYLQLENQEKSVLGDGVAPEWLEIEIGAWRDWAEGKIK